MNYIFQRGNVVEYAFLPDPDMVTFGTYAFNSKQGVWFIIEMRSMGHIWNFVPHSRVPNETRLMALLLTGQS